MTQQPAQPHLTVIGTPSNLQEAATRANKNKRKTYLAQKIKVGLALALALLLLTPGITSTQAPTWASLIYAALILIIETYTSSTKPTREWVEARSVAENIKTCTWLYAAHGSPYNTGNDAEDNLRYRIDLARNGQKFQVGHIPAHTHTRRHTLSRVQTQQRKPAEGVGVTAEATIIRQTGFQERKETYLQGRAHPMLNWYKARATHHKRLGVLWKTILTLAQLTAITLLVGQLAGWWHVDLSSILGALIAAAASWSGAKQHPYLATIYKATVANLGNRIQGLKNADEKEWGTLVTRYEDTLQEATKQWGAFRLGHN